jgi:cell division protein FtsI (penicillin-binding protein 3)
MAKPVARIRAVEIVFLLAVGAVIARAGHLQIVQGGHWSREAARLRTERDTMPARRGTIYDRNGSPLAVTQEFYHLGIAPNEIDDRADLVRKISRSLGIPASRLNRDLRSSKTYLYYHGPFTAQQVEAIRALGGVHLEPEYSRFYPALGLARPVIGGLKPDGSAGASGLELSLDSLLTGIPGERVLLRDIQGRRYESPSRLIREPVAGNNVFLSLDNELQEIAESGLEDAIRSMRAEGGDVVFYDPRNGELLALAGLQIGANGIMTARPTMFTDPFEPGSTAKLFTAAALLSLNKVAASDAVFAEGGLWMMPVGNRETRKIEDTHRSEGSLTLAQAIGVSSNVAMAKFSERLSPEEQFGALRDFGFGSPTGVEFPSESRGRLMLPNRWKPAWSRASIAMGYEFLVTPVQLAVAYGAIANDGILLSPTLVREVRAPDGGVIYQRKPEPVRRAVTPEVAARLREYLSGAVGEGGTGERAQLANYTLIGKTGTAVRFEDGRYVRGQYTASFAALFPATDPQLVVIVKIDNPQGDYYGGQTAAPLTRNMLQQALASREVAIDRNRLGVAEVQAQTRAVADAPATNPVVAVGWPFHPDSVKSRPLQEVPNLAGESVRRAVVTLHRRGFKVALRGLGRVTRTTPGPGDSVRVGRTVTVWAE